MHTTWLQELRKGMLMVQAKSPKKPGNNKRSNGGVNGAGSSAHTAGTGGGLADAAEQAEAINEPSAKKPKQSRR